MAGGVPYGATEGSSMGPGAGRGISLFRDHFRDLFSEHFFLIFRPRNGPKIDPKMVPKWPPKGAPKLEPSWRQTYCFFVGFKSKNEESGAKGRKARVDTRKQNRSQMDFKMTLSFLSLLSSVFALSSLQRAKIAFGNGVRK